MQCPNPQCDKGVLHSTMERFVPGQGMVPYPDTKCMFCGGTGEVGGKVIEEPVPGIQESGNIEATSPTRRSLVGHDTTGTVCYNSDVCKPDKITENKEVKMPNNVSCPLCGGKDKNCPVCEGTGKINARQRILMPDGSIKESHELLKHDNGIWVGAVKYVKKDKAPIPGDPAPRPYKPSKPKPEKVVAMKSKPAIEIDASDKGMMPSLNSNAQFDAQPEKQPMALWMSAGDVIQVVVPGYKTKVDVTTALNDDYTITIKAIKIGD